MAKEERARYDDILGDVEEELVTMPTISVFFGIVIRMYYFPKEHPPAHFHAIYGEHEAQVAIETVEALAGDLPPRAMAMVLEWARLHQSELMDNWRRCQEQEPLKAIEPLG